MPGAFRPMIVLFFARNERRRTCMRRTEEKDMSAMMCRRNYFKKAQGDNCEIEE